MRPHLYQNTVSAGLSARVQTRSPAPSRCQMLFFCILYILIKLKSARRAAFLWPPPRCNSRFPSGSARASHTLRAHVTASHLITCLLRLHKCVFSEKAPHVHEALRRKVCCLAKLLFVSRAGLGLRFLFGSSAVDRRARLAD